MDALIHSINPSIAQRRRRRELVDLKSVLLLLISACLSLSAAAEPVRNVLVIYSDNRLLPANVEVDGALRDALVAATGRPVELFSEFLDRSRFAGDAYESTTSTFLAQKYSANVPDVVGRRRRVCVAFPVAEPRGSVPARSDRFHRLVARPKFRRLRRCRATSSECRSTFDYVGTIEQALRFHPNATRLVLITGANRFDRLDEARLAGVPARLNGRVSVESWSGLPIDAIVKRVGSLGPTDVVFAPGFFTDGAGRQFSPRESTQIVAQASNAPVYGPFNTFIGTGIVGGLMPSLCRDG